MQLRSVPAVNTFHYLIIIKLYAHCRKYYINLHFLSLFSIAAGVNLFYVFIEFGQCTWIQYVQNVTLIYDVAIMKMHGFPIKKSDCFLEERLYGF